MKTSPITFVALSCLGAVSACGQATVNFSDFVSGVVFSHIYGPQTNEPGAALVGNIATPYSPTTPWGDFPVGTTVYNGVLMGGAATGPTNQLDLTNGYLYTVELWGAPGDNVPESDLGLLYGSNLRTGPSTNSAGFFVPISFIAAYNFYWELSWTGSGTFQLRAWYNGGGTIPDWNTAQYQGVLQGPSPAFNIDGLGSLPLGLPSNLAGLQSFNLYSPSLEQGLPFIFSQPSPTTVSVGGTAQFWVETYGALGYQWHLNGTNLTDNSRISGSQTANLTISEVQLSDAGNYQLSLQNFSGTTNSDAATLTVTVPPPMLQVAVSAPTNGSFSFRFSAMVSQPYQIQYSSNLGAATWFNLGGPLTSSSGSITVTDSATNTVRFYRVVAKPQ